VKETRALLQELDPNRKIGIALDEWGIWHPEARSWGPGGQGDCSGEYVQAATLRDAILAAIALEGFHRQCDSLTLANLAQITNVLQALAYTQEGRMWLSPTYYAFKLHAAHIGATALRTEVEGAESLPSGKPGVSATATRGAKGLCLTLINRHFRSPMEVRLPDWARSATVLGADDPRAENSLGEPDRVGLTNLAISQGVIELPPHSVATAG